MYPHLAHVFVDGGHLREVARAFHGHLVNPRDLASTLVQTTEIQDWAADPLKARNALLGRVTYYDALPAGAESADADTDAYWKAVELLRDTHLGFGELRGIQRRLRQKAVDTLLAVNMVAGAFSGLFDIAVLVAGDADFVPVVEEVRRRGVMVTVAAYPPKLSDELRRAADRFIPIPLSEQWLPALMVEGKPLRA